MTSTFRAGSSTKSPDTVVAGTKVVTADIEGIIAGLSICYDVRFPEIYQLQALNGAKILFVPAAFMLYTGRDHWGRRSGRAPWKTSASSSLPGRSAPICRARPALAEA